MKHIIIIAVIAALSISSILWFGSMYYYQAVYDTCVRMSAVNGQVTSFDLLQCREMERHARADGWMFQEIP